MRKSGAQFGNVILHAVVTGPAACPEPTVTVPTTAAATANAVTSLIIRICCSDNDAFLRPDHRVAVPVRPALIRVNHARIADDI